MLEILNGRDKFYQWDVNQKLIVDDTIIAVHYDNGTGDALVCGVYEYEGQRVADVPNIMLQTCWAIKCYAYCGECVRAEKVYEVEKRSRPDDYIYTETETLRYTTLLEMLNNTNSDLEALAAEHTADMETVEAQLAATNKDVATANDEIAKNADDIAAVNYSYLDYKEFTDTRLDNHWRYINTLNTEMDTAQADIEALKANGTGGGTAADVDWAENNPDSPAYIKNRTHYVETGVNGTLLEERSPDEIDDGVALFAYPCLEAEPQVGMKYKVNYNGVEYECVAVDSADITGEAGYVVLGNYGAMTGGTDTGEPFIIMMLYEEMAIEAGMSIMCVPLDGATEITLGITYNGDVIHKLENKYLDLDDYAKTAYVDEVKTNVETQLSNIYTKTELNTMLSHKMIGQETTTLTGRATYSATLQGYSGVIESMAVITIPAAATSNDEIIVKAGFNGSNLLTTYTTDGGIVAGESRKIIIHNRNEANLAFIKIYKPKADGLTEVIEDVISAQSWEKSIMRWVDVSTVSGNNFPDGTTIRMYAKWGAV